MKTDLLHPFDTIPYFTLEGFIQSAGMASSKNAGILLHRWAKAGHILQLKKGVYMTRGFYEQHRGHPLFTAAVSTILQPQSYLSLEYILQQHNVLTEVTYPVTSITMKNTRRIENRLGMFSYRHIRQDLYRGFSITEVFGIQTAQASPAKALFDYLYLRPLPSVFRRHKYNLAGELRLNLDEFHPKDQSEFTHYVEESGSRKLQEILDNFRSHTWQP